MNNTKNISILGYGHRGQEIANIINSTIDLRVLSIYDHKLLNYYKYLSNESTNGARFFTDFEEFIRHSRCSDIFFIATTANFHLDLFLKLKSNDINSPIIIEKPLSNNIIMCKKLLEKHHDSDFFDNVYIFYQRRSSTLYSEIRDLIVSGEMGNLLKVEVETFGTLSMNGSHFIDLLLFLNPSAVSKIHQTLKPSYDVDHRGSTFNDLLGEISIILEDGVEFNLRMDDKNNISKKMRDTKITIELEQIRIIINSGEKMVHTENASKTFMSDLKSDLWVKSAFSKVLETKTGLASFRESVTNLEIIHSLFYTHSRGIQEYNFSEFSDFEGDLNIA